MRRSSSRQDRTPPSRALLSGVGHWLAWLLLLLSAGCDQREIAGPNPVPIPRGPAPRNEAAPVLLGAYSTPIEVADRPSSVTTVQRAHPAGVPIPANSYVLLRVSGRVRLVSGPWWPGPARPIATYTAVQSTQVTSRAQTRVWIRSSAEVEPPAGGYEPRFRPAPDGEDRIVLVRTGDVPAELWTGRDMGGYLITATDGWCIATPWCSPSPGEIAEGGMWADRKEIEAYHVAESNIVTAALIPEPLQIAAPDSFAPGQPATMSIQAWGGMRLRHPQIVAADTADVEWRWFQGDTAAVRNPGITAQRLPCNKKVCTFTPGAAGRMSVATWVEGAYVEASEIVRVQQQRMQLRCPISVQRGSTMTCTVAAVPSGTLDSVRWTFVDTAGNTVRDSLRLSWDGRLVVGGRMSVSAKLNGQIVSADTSIAVQPRTWVSPVPAIRHGTQGCATLTDTCLLLYPPVSYGDMGSTVSTPRGFTLHDRAATISTGPNAGWSWVTGNTSPFQYTEKVILVNRVLSANDTSQVTTTFWNNNPQCDRATMLQDVIAHETHHVQLYIRNRAVLDAEAERTLAFGLSAAEWRTRLAPGGTEARRLASRQGDLSGSMHRRTDGFPTQSCTLNLLP